MQEALILTCVPGKQKQTSKSGMRTRNRTRTRIWTRTQTRIWTRTRDSGLGTRQFGVI